MLNWIKKLNSKIFSKSKPTPHKADFGETGLQYYISGRFSFFCGFSPITGNLLHHAVELFLKMALSQHFSDEQFKNKFRHKLKLLWKEFKRKYPVSNLNKYDTTINKLNEWEEMRYPSSRNRVMSLGLIPLPLPPRTGKGPQPKHYVLSLDGVDELVKIIFTTSNTNPRIFKRVFIGTEIGPKAKEFINFENKNPLQFD